MSAARTVSTAPDLRQYALGLGVVLAAIAIVVAVALARPASVTVPASVAPATVQFDHGWSSAASNTKALTVSGTRGGGINYTGIPYQAVQGQRSWIIRGTTGGGIVYTGIPTAPQRTLLFNHIPSGSSDGSSTSVSSTVDSSTTISTPSNGTRGMRFEQ